MDMGKKKVAVIGALNVDIGGRSSGPLVRGDSIPGRVGLTLGGVGWNIARNCALLGADTSFFSLLGRDEHEPSIRDESARYCVNIDGCRWVDETNNRYLYVCDEHGDMTAAVNDMGLCRQMDPAFAAGCLDRAASAGAVVVDANLPQETLRYLGGALRAPIVADGVSIVKSIRLRPILDKLAILKANLQEAEALTGRTGVEECIRALLDAGVKRVVISRGAEGVVCSDGGEIFPVNSVHTDVVDSTGAGDSMTAALTVGLVRDMDFADCAALGVTAAGITVANPGAVTAALAVLRP